MGPSRIAGFRQQCRKCQALDTEIQFALGEHCPADDLIPESELAVKPVSEPAREISSTSLLAAQVQATWFQGYFARQLARAQR